MAAGAAVMAIGFLFAFADPALGAPKQASVSIFDDDNGQALFPHLVMAPGRPYTQCISVDAAASTTSEYVQFGAVNVLGDLAEHLYLQVDMGDGGSFGDCSGFAGERLFDGTLAELAATKGGYGLDTDWRPATDAQRSFRFTVGIDPSVAQGLTAQGSFAWRLLGSNDDPSPGPSVTPTVRPTISPSPEISIPPTGGPTDPVTPPPSPAPSPTDPGPAPSPSWLRPAPVVPPDGSDGGGTQRTPGQNARNDRRSGGSDLTIGGRLSELAQVAERAQAAGLAVVTAPQYPLTVTTVAVLFLLVQDRIDRRDPKLAVANARQRDNELEFPDRFGVRRSS